MTNHAEVIREALDALIHTIYGLVGQHIGDHIHIPALEKGDQAIDALDALTREAENWKQLCLESRALDDEARAAIAAHAERIKALEEVVNYYLDPNGMDSPTNIKAMEAKARAALAPKEAQG